MKSLSANTCCFTGHRIIAQDNILKIQTSLERIILELIEKNVFRFMCGGAIGFDMLSAFEVLRAKEKHKFIQLHLIVPFEGYNNRWNAENKFHYNQIIEKCDKKILASDENSVESIFLRNRMLVDSSSYCVAYLDKRRMRGGTKYTVNYAVEKNVRLLMIEP